MSKSEIIEGNKLIANFDLVMRPDPTDWKKESWYRGFNWVHLNKLEYHSSFDWIMPVVEKMSDYGVWTLRPDFAAFENYKGELRPEKQFHFNTSQMDWETDDEEPVKWAFLIHSIVVKYLTWLNSQPNQQTSKKEEK
jgi:hypothetical protein